jgi:16S rRNA (cytosine967-C5)-methyltransferase
LENAAPFASPPLATSLRLAGDAVAAVISGRSLTDAMAGVPATSRGAVMDLSYGTVRFLARYRFLLERLLTRSGTDPRAVGVLLVALHALASARREEHTVVDQAVDAVAGIRRGAAKGLVNAVLRAYLRRRDELDAEVSRDEVCRYCYPAWWIARVKQAYPEHWETVLDAGNEHPPMALRVNRRRATAAEYLARLEGAGLQGRAIGGAAIVLEKPVQVDRLPGFFEGWVSVQDLGAQFAAPMLDVRDGMRVLDACAAPGGKAGHLLELADADLTAVDVDERRLARVRQNLSRLGLEARLTAGDCGDPQFVLRLAERGGFDRILVDAPCSASGVVRRHPDAKWLRRESDLARFASAQGRILDALWQSLGRDGKLLYATCSVFPEENAERIAAFLDAHRDARVIHQSNDGQLLPDRDHDGFYYALLGK